MSSLLVCRCGLAQDDARGVFKTLNMDLRQYGKLNMFIHAESVINQAIVNDGDLKAVIRLGNDFSGNYYEVKIPLKVTEFGATDSARIWPRENYLDFELEELTKLKTRRNNQALTPSQYYSETNTDGRTYAIMGNPNLGEVRGMLLAVENAKVPEFACTEVWFNELRLSRLDEKAAGLPLAVLILNWPIWEHLPCLVLPKAGALVRWSKELTREAGRTCTHLMLQQILKPASYYPGSWGFRYRCTWALAEPQAHLNTILTTWI
ncbi:MAG: hypothetical protein IPM85_09210 [Chitinophagaceae bacterium]|nr:hypothetical protein [Chitinophagaceae bacterium]